MSEELNKLAKIELTLGVLTCFLLPFKITLCYFALIPFVYIQIFFHGREVVRIVKSFPVLRILFLFILTASATSLLGINILRSLKHFGTLFFFPLTIVCFYRLTLRHTADPFMKASLYGLSFACLIQLVEMVLPFFNTRFLGPVSQSGQIALLLIPLAYYYLSSTQKDLRRYFFNVSCLLPIILAFVCNLKRGPWLGLLISLSLFCLIYYRRFFFGLLALTAALLLLEPIRDRILLSETHFFIAGGRSAIWKIGQELLFTYPLGVGFENSGFLREFSNEIPAQLKHFHSNILNIAVETGWLGVGLFLAWLYSLLKFTLNASGINAKLSHAIGFGLLSWQIAGLVEYNFGDSAVVTFAYILIGILLGLNSSREDFIR